MRVLTSLYGNPSLWDHEEAGQLTNARLVVQTSPILVYTLGHPGRTLAHTIYAIGDQAECCIAATTTIHHTALMDACVVCMCVSVCDNLCLCGLGCVYVCRYVHVICTMCVCYSPIGNC